MELHAIKKILHGIDDAFFGSFDLGAPLGLLITRRQVTLARRGLVIRVRDHAEIATRQHDLSRLGGLRCAAAAFARVLVALVGAFDVRQRGTQTGAFLQIRKCVLVDAHFAILDDLDETFALLGRGKDVLGRAFRLVGRMAMRLALLTTTFRLRIGNQAFLLARRRWAKTVFGILFDGESVFAVFSRRFLAFEIEARGIWSRDGCTDLQFFAVDDTLGLNALSAALLVVRRHVFKTWIALVFANDASLAIYWKAGLFILHASEVAAAVMNDRFAHVDGNVALEDALGLDADAAALAFWHHQFFSEFASHAVDHRCLNFGGSLVSQYALVNGAWIFFVVPFLSWLSDVGRQFGVGLFKADNWFAFAAACQLFALLIDLRFEIFVAWLTFCLALGAEAFQTSAALV